MIVRFCWGVIKINEATLSGLHYSFTTAEQRDWYFTLSKSASQNYITRAYFQLREPNIYQLKV
jgi:hypothetical protein